MNILFLNEYSFPNVVSGAELSMQALAGKLTQKNKIIVLSPNLGKKNRYLSQGVWFFKFPFPVKVKPYQFLSPAVFNNPIFWLYSFLFIIYFIYKEKIDLIHVHGKYILPAAIFTRIFTGKKVIITVRDYKFLCPLSLCFIKKGSKCDFAYFLKKELPFYLKTYEKNKGFFYKLLISLRVFISKLFQEINYWFLNRADKIICVSQAVKQIYQKNGVDTSKLIVIYNLPPVINNNVRRLGNKKFKILSVGKISYGKGSDILIEAYQDLVKTNPEIELTLIGGKSSSIADLPENIKHFRKIDNEEVINCYKKADVFVLLSRWPEPLSRAALEALSSGLPLILSQNGGNSEVVEDGVNGFLIPVDKNKLKEKIIKLKNNQKLGKKMGIKSLAVYRQKFNPQKIINQHLELYKELAL